MKRRTVDLLILFVVLVIGLVAVKNATAIGDWWFFSRYVPSDEVEQLATNAGMSDYGRKLFYRLDPQFVNRQEIISKCGSDALGCTVGRNIYILNDHTPAQYNRSIVTAAHEMLHVAYDRLTDSERSTVDSQLDVQFKQTYQSLLDKFGSFEAYDHYNEAHSYIGTEESNLTPDLQVHYSNYFDDRQKVLDALMASPES